MQKKDKIQCSTQGCQKKIQAACFTCQKLTCFNCSLSHAKVSPDHQVYELDASMNQIRQRSSEMLSKLKIQHKNAQSKANESDKNKSSLKNKQYDQRINPQKFQQQLNYISSMEKETVKIVQKFYSQLSLEVVNIWENYLNNFINSRSYLQSIQSLMKKIQNYSEVSKKTQETGQHLHNYFRQNFPDQIVQYEKNLGRITKNDEDTPLCPDINIDEKLLIEISQLLCSRVSSKNYQYQRIKIKPEQKIHISTPDTIQKTVNFLPIFPICKQYCYLYNIDDNSYQIQEFQKLQFLPSFPKSIILWNGDIHLIGGADENEKVIKSHIVFRSTTAEVFKLVDIPVPRNPVNGLLTKNKTIYMIGGLNQNKQWDTQCFAYSLDKKQWSEIESMKFPKPHQTSVFFEDKIYCFGIPSQNSINIEEYDSLKNKWKQIKIANFLCNPFNFAASFSSIQVNKDQILLFGGKKYVENLKNKKRSTDREIIQFMYLYQPYNQSFVQLGSLNPCIGVSDGQINPVIKNGKIFVAQYLISKTQPISRWLSAMTILQITNQGKAQSIIVLHED